VSRPKSGRVPITILITPEERKQLDELSTIGVVPVAPSAVAAHAFSLGLAAVFAKNQPKAEKSKVQKHQ